MYWWVLTTVSWVMRRVFFLPMNMHIYTLFVTGRVAFNCCSAWIRIMFGCHDVYVHSFDSKIWRRQWSPRRHSLSHEWSIIWILLSSIASLMRVLFIGSVFNLTIIIMMRFTYVTLTTTHWGDYTKKYGLTYIINGYIHECWWKFRMENKIIKCN